MPATIYTWSDRPEDRPLPLITRRRIIGEKMMISEVHLARGFTVAAHAHENEQLSVVLSGCIRFTIGHPGSPDHHTHTLIGGQVIHLPSNLPHAAEALEDTLILDLFSPPSTTTGVDAKK